LIDEAFDVAEPVFLTADIIAQMPPHERKAYAAKAREHSRAACLAPSRLQGRRCGPGAGPPRCLRCTGESPPVEPVAQRLRGYGLPARPRQHHQDCQGTLHRPDRRGGGDEAGRGRRRAPTRPAGCAGKARFGSRAIATPFPAHHARPALRLHALRRDGFKCVSFGARRRFEIDHIAPVRDAPDKAHDRASLQALCAGCHARKTRKEAGHPERPPET
jgi:HNH endonuclease.